MRSQSPAGRELDVVGARAAQRARAPRRARPPRRPRSGRGRGACACRRGPGGRSRGRRATGRRPATSCCSRGSTISTAITPWRARRARSGASQSRSPRKSETITTSPRWRPSAAALPSARAERRRAGALVLGLAAQLGEQREQAQPALARAQDPRLAAAEGEHAEPVAAARRDVADGQRDALGDVGLAAVGGAERHRGRDVEHEPGRQRALADVHAHVRLAQPRRRVPVDVADVVAREVRPDHRQLGAGAGLRRQVLARDAGYSIRFITARSSERRTCGGTGPGRACPASARAPAGPGAGLTGASRRARARSRRRPAAARARRRRRPTSPAASPWSWSAACRGCGRRPASRCASAVAKNWPPVSRAMSCSVSRSGGTRSVLVCARVRVGVRERAVLRAERDRVDRDLELLGVLHDVDRVRRRACSRRRRAARSPPAAAASRRARPATGTRAELIASFSASPIAVAPATCSELIVVFTRAWSVVGSASCWALEPKPTTPIRNVVRHRCPRTSLPASLRGGQPRRLRRRWRASSPTCRRRA